MTCGRARAYYVDIISKCQLFLTKSFFLPSQSLVLLENEILKIKSTKLWLLVSHIPNDNAASVISPQSLQIRTKYPSRSTYTKLIQAFAVATFAKLHSRCDCSDGPKALNPIY